MYPHAYVSSFLVIRLPIVVISQVEYQTAQPLLKLRIVRVLLEQFHIIGHDEEDDLLQYTVAPGMGFLFIAVAHSIP